MDRIYHGCMTKNAGSTNRLIGPEKKCLVPTARPFWKYIEDIRDFRSKNTYSVQKTTNCEQ